MIATSELTDIDMAAQIAAAQAAAHDILVIVNAFTAVAASRAAGETHWRHIGDGEFGIEAGKAARKVIKANRLHWREVSDSPNGHALSQASGSPISLAELDAWVKRAQGLTLSGRGDMPARRELDAYAADAAWRCQFHGCGKNLHRHSATGTRSNSSYFAHIVASSPEGPRGSAQSLALSTDVNNIILLCDECHRLVDRQAPGRFTEAVLQRMRTDGLAEVRRLLDTMTHQSAQVVVVMGNVASQSPHFNQNFAEAAMWLRKLRAAPGHRHSFFENDWRTHEPHLRSYWEHFFGQAQAEVVQLRKLLATNRVHNRLAVFPLHGTSILALAGRMFGDAAAADVFQYRRLRSTDLQGGPWGFEDVEDIKAGFESKVLQDAADNQSEACLLISFTFDIDPERLPEEIFRDGKFRMPALKVFPNDGFGVDSIRHPRDLDRAASVIGEAITRLQDEWKVGRVHLVIGAPPSVVFKVGQKMQARHQADFVCYEAEMAGPTSRFLPTITIGGRKACFTSAPELSLDLA